MTNLSKIAGAVLMSAGLSTSAFAESDTERGQTPAAPAAAGRASPAP
jgi:hypothetical protein